MSDTDFPHLDGLLKRNQDLHNGNLCLCLACRAGLVASLASDLADLIDADFDEGQRALLFAVTTTHDIQKKPLGEMIQLVLDLWHEPDIVGVTFQVTRRQMTEEQLHLARSEPQGSA